MRGLDAEAEDSRNLPVGLAHCHEAKALDLAPAEPRPGSGRRQIAQPPRGAQRMSPDQLGAVQCCNRHFSAGADRERAGGGRLSRHIRGNGEAAAKPEMAAARQDLLVAALERDECNRARTSRSRCWCAGWPNAPDRRAHSRAPAVR